jgi:hypothetical protein
MLYSSSHPEERERDAANSRRTGGRSTEERARLPKGVRVRGSERGERERAERERGEHVMVTETGSHHVLYVCKPCETRACRVAAAFFAVVMADDASSDGWSAEAAAEWLGGECGGKVLAAELQEILLKGFEDNEWTKDELPTDGTNVKDAQEMWEAALAGSAHAHGTVRVKPLFKVTLGQWIAAQCISGEDDGTSSKPSSKAEKDDLAAQGMKRPIELKRLELAAFLGRTVRESETAKGSYRGMPQPMEGGKLAVKFQHPTLDTRIKMCRESGTLSVLDAHYTNLAAEMTDPAANPRRSASPRACCSSGRSRSAT